MHPKVPCSTIYNYQDMETTQTSISRGLDEEDAVHMHKGILLLLLLSRFSRVRLCATP